MGYGYGLDLRMRIVDAYDNREGSVRELAERFDVAPGTVQSYLNLRRATGRVEPRPPSGGVAPLIRGEDLPKVQRLVEEQPDATTDELADHLARKYGIAVSRPTMGLALARLRITRKKTLHAAEQDSPRVQKERRRFRRRVKKLSARKFVFVDEFGTNLGMTRRYARALRGKRAVGAVPDNADPNITLVMGLRHDGIVAPFAFQGAMDGEAFTAYVQTQLAPELHRGDVVFVDGLGAHRTASARAVIEAHGARLEILPPYSPDLSPVEKCGGKVKDVIRGMSPRTVSAVIDAMGDGVGAVTAADARAWFASCGYRINAG
jgi:transposase